MKFNTISKIIKAREIYPKRVFTKIDDQIFDLEINENFTSYFKILKEIYEKPNKHISIPDELIDFDTVLKLNNWVIEDSI